LQSEEATANFTQNKSETLFMEIELWKMWKMQVNATGMDKHMYAPAVNMTTNAAGTSGLLLIFKFSPL
jgi:hypothetical protein